MASHEKSYIENITGPLQAKIRIYCTPHLPSEREKYREVYRECMNE